MLERRMVAAAVRAVSTVNGAVMLGVNPRLMRSELVRAERPHEPLGVAHRVVAGSVILVREWVDHVGAGRDRSIVVRVGIVDDHVDRARSEVEERALSRRPIGETDEAAVVLELRVARSRRRGCGAPRTR